LPPRDLKQTNLEAQNKRNAAHIACALTRLIAGRTNSSIIAIKKKNGIIDIIILNMIKHYINFLFFFIVINRDMPS
jgi:hypothetical protein